jgi:hypothetical protein
MMESKDHPLAYFWINVMTLGGRGCSFLETQFDRVSFSKGEYRGTCAVVGVPRSIFRDLSPLLNRLKKYRLERGAKRHDLRLTISDTGYDYCLSSGLRAVISRGMMGTLLEGSRRIGKVRGPTTAWLQNLPPFDLET